MEVFDEQVQLREEDIQRPRMGWCWKRLTKKEIFGKPEQRTITTAGGASQMWRGESLVIRAVERVKS
jgi:hypothetical protein